MTQNTTQRQTVRRTSMRAPLLRRTLAGISLLMLVSGCATVVSGPSQHIGIASIPTGATVSVDNVARGQTPVLTPLSRKDDHLVKVELPGYHPFEATLTRSVNGWVFGNILIGGLIGVGVDALSGAMYSLTPGQITASLLALPHPPESRERVAQPVMTDQPVTASLLALPHPPGSQERVAQPVMTDQPVKPSASPTAPQCVDATIRAQCPLYQYRTGIYRGTCKDGSGVEVGPESVKVIPPPMGNPPHPWQAEGCLVATAG